jgi:hypothetical protein
MSWKVRSTSWYSLRKSWWLSITLVENDGTEKRIKRTTVLFAEDTGEVKRMTDEVVCSGQVSSKKGD